MPVKMTKELKNRWTRRLRSGNLNQTTEYLRRTNEKD